MNTRIKGFASNAFLALMTFLSVASACRGAEYRFQPGCSDFSDPQSYRLESGATPPNCPGSSDEILLPEGEEIVLAAPSASFDTFANCLRVKPQQGTVVKITVAEGKATLNAAVNNHVIGSSDYGKGELVKLGGGELWLNSNAGCPKNGTAYYDYYIGLTVAAGTLRMPQACTADSAYYGKVTVADGAVLYITASAGNNPSWTHIRQLMGAGEIRNEPGVSGSSRSGNSLALDGTAGAEDSVFTGKICQPITFYNDAGGNVTLTNPDSTYSATFLEGGNGLYPQSGARGILRAASFAAPGPLGGGAVNFTGNGGVIAYVGDEEETVERSFSFSGKTHAPVIDAGAFGGLDFTGDWTLNTGNDFERTVVLCGSNVTEAAVLDNAMVTSTAEATSRFKLVKRGSGTWKLGDGNADRRTALGGLAVEDGTMQFSSIAEKGLPCSLGETLEEIEIGSEGKNPVLEYVGSEDASCTTRSIKLVAGGGSLRNSTAQALSLTGVSARDENASTTLTLDGSGENEGNVVKGISDGAAGARVSVVKDGAGTWKIGGDLTFSGDVRVLSGGLTIDSPQGKPDPVPYKWFRLSFAEIGSGNSQLTIREICLFDKDGNRQNEGLEFLQAEGVDATALHDVYIPDTIGPGQAGYDKGAAGLKAVSKYATEFGASFVGLFSGNSAVTQISWYDANGSVRPPAPSARATWIPIVMHLKDDANPVTHFDIQGMSNQENRNNWPTHFLLEASLDGEDWDVVYDKTGGDRYDYSTIGGPGWGNYDCNVWLSDGKPAVQSGEPTFKTRALNDGSWANTAYEGVPRTNFTWFRLSVAKIGNGSNTLRIREICLFDKDGKRQNDGLTFLLDGASAAGKHQVHVPASIASGEAGYDATASGHQINTRYGAEFGACFANTFAGDSSKFDASWLTASGSTCAPNPSDRSTWIPIVMHLRKEANPVTHFDIQGFNNAENRNMWPTRLLLEGSRDGKIWYTVFDNATKGEAFDMSSIGGSGYSNPECNVWLSDGADACTAGTDTYHHRVLGDGWQAEISGIPYEGPYDQFAHVRSVRVDGGAMLTASHVLPIKALTVDASQNAVGTIEGFDFSSAGGFVDVLGPIDWSSPKLPISFVSCTGVENIANWTVREDGRPKTARRISVKNGELYLERCGVILIVR